ncbi:hypothetical protein DsansV1_C03g0029451 [Dioscorea sansibarensis]
MLQIGQLSSSLSFSKMHFLQTVWRHMDMVVASRRSLWQRGHVKHFATGSLFTLPIICGGSTTRFLRAGHGGGRGGWGVLLGDSSAMHANSGGVQRSH